MAVSMRISWRCWLIARHVNSESMRRLLLTLLSILSLALCLAACAIWVRSYHASEFALLDRTDDVRRLWLRRELFVERGEVRLGRARISQQACSRDETMSGWPTGWRHGIVSKGYPPLLDPWYALQGRSTNWYTFAGQAPPSGAHCLGFGRYVATYRMPSRQVEQYRFWVVPLWLVAATFAIAPATVVRRWALARRRRRRGFCSTCGYDLRATPDRCPECGTAVG